MREVVRVAAAPLNSVSGGAEENIARIAVEARRAAESGAQLALFPELSVTGFIPNHPVGDHDAWLRAALKAARGCAQRVPGPATEALTEIARETGVLIAAGVLEDAGSRLFNTHVLCGPDGLLGRWRKLHVPMFEMPFYNGGSELEVADTKLGRIGVNICFDALLPESTRLLAVEGVEIVLFPFAADPAPGTVKAWAEWALPAVKARCAENGVFGLAVNCAGRFECVGVEQTFPGGAAAVGPRGEALNGPEGGMVVAEFRAEDLQAARAEPESLFRFRRPELYGPLTRIG